MAGLDTEPLESRSAPHDGLAVCRCCSTTEAEAEHEWCASASGLVCRTCCQRLLLSRMGMLMAGMSTPDSFDESVPEQLEACASCERGRRWFAQHVVGFMTRGTLPS